MVKRCNKHTRIDDSIYERFHDRSLGLSLNIVGQGGEARPEPQGDRNQVPRAGLPLGPDTGLGIRSMITAEEGA